MRFAIPRTPVWKWLLVLFGATENASQVEVGDELDVHFGRFHERFAYSELAGAELAMRTLPWYLYSIGWRTNLLGRVALIGAPRNIVKLTLARPRRLWLMGVPVRCTELYISIDNPDLFLAMLGPKLRPVA